MPPTQRPGGRQLTRADLPQEFTPESMRHLGLRQLAQLRRPNDILTPTEQAQFDAAFDSLVGDVRGRLRDADGWVRRGGPRGLDPDMRRSYTRTQQRLEEQARRAREALPQLEQPEATDHTVEAPVATDHDGTEDVSAESLTEQIEESSTILELLDRIATIEEQQLEHHRSQLLLDTRGFFFAFLVSVAVIVAGVAPLVEAEPHDRLLIVAWTALAIVLAGLVYAAVRASQRKK